MHYSHISCISQLLQFPIYRLRVAEQLKTHFEAQNFNARKRCCDKLLVGGAESFFSWWAPGSHLSNFTRNSDAPVRLLWMVWACKRASETDASAVLARCGENVVLGKTASHPVRAVGPTTGALPRAYFKGSQAKPTGASWSRH